jgi:hypothetical protein
MEQIGRIAVQTTLKSPFEDSCFELKKSSGSPIEIQCLKKAV